LVIDGLRYGTAHRLGFSHDDIVAVNPTVVYCVPNGMGSYGPYTRLATVTLVSGAIGRSAPCRAARVSNYRAPLGISLPDQHP